MLENYLYSLIKNIIITDTALDKTNYLDNNLKDLLKIRRDFYILWRNKFNLFSTNEKFLYNYNILEENKNFIKCTLTLNMHCVFYKNIASSYIYNYLLIIEKASHSYKIVLALNSEEDSHLFNHYIKCPLDNINFNISSFLVHKWRNNIAKINYLFFNYHSYIFHKNTHYRKSIFNIQKAAEYAETYAIIPNINYKSFEFSGGDCTNFVSQILHAGNIKTTNSWKPYTNSWVRVEEFYSYVINNGIGLDVTHKNEFSRGNFLQFSTYERNRFFHSGFITYELKSDCLYCCHTYNKLNYPLSQIYPFIYPIIRIVKIH